MSEQFDVILGGLDTEVDVTIADSTGVDPSVILALRGEQGVQGEAGNGIADISLTSTSGNVDTYTITYDDGDADTFTVTNGVDGQDGADGADGADGYSPTATVTKSGDTATITITDKDGTTTASISDGSGGASAFVAEFNVTTYADVKDAYDNDAILICTVDDSGNPMVFQFVYFDATNEVFFFAVPMRYGWYLTQLSNADGWDDGQFYFASTDVATQLADGLMSALDKQKLDAIASGAEVNVQSDWSQSDNTKDDFIKNKPTKLSQFTNDSGYITGYTETDPVFSASAASGITSSDISDWNSKSEVSVTRHTTTGTNIADLTIDGTTTKLYAPTGGGGGGITDVTVDGTSVVTGTTAAIDLTGKSDVGHTHTTSAITDFPALATVATSGDYDDLTDKPTIPSNVSDLVNDSGFITSPNVVYCTCGTGTSTVAKVATIVSGSLSSLNTGDQAIVKFTYANSATNPTLQVGSTTAKNIKKYGSTAPGTSGASSWQANSCILFVYDGTDWQMCDWNNTTYSEISSTNIKSSSSSSTGLISGRRAKAAVDEFAPVKDVTVGGTSVMSGTTAVVPAIPTVPTNVSDFVNDAGYLTSYTETDPMFTASDAYGIDSTDISNWNGKAEISDIPTDTSDLTNGAGFLDASAILNMFYPIGSYYETSDTSFNPNNSWGGTWVLEAEGQVHISAGANYAVSGALTDTTDGGAETVTLTAGEIPAHTHGSSSPSFSFSMRRQGNNAVSAWNISNTTITATASANITSNASGSSNKNGDVVSATLTHTHDSVGGGNAHNNMQPYIIVNRWHRTA